MTYAEQLQTQEWRELSDRIKRRDADSCQTCMSLTNLQVHHKRYISGRKAWEYEDSYLITLCDTCHNKVHGLPVQKDNPRGEPFESSMIEDCFYNIAVGLRAIQGLNARIAMNEINKERYPNG